jgi:hypothetical protein
VESLYLKLNALYSMFDRLQPRQKSEAGVTANVLLSLIGRLKTEVSSLPMRYSQMEAEAHAVHGRIALNEGTEESARRAVIHLENQLEVNESIGDVEGIAMAQANIAVAKSKYEGTGSNEVVLKASQELYALRVAELGEEHEHTIKSGKNYAIELQDATREADARELLTKLLATSKRVLGPHHKTTKRLKQR